jgi:TolB-like protein/AraC-like DNA-binding protein
MKRSNTIAVLPFRQRSSDDTITFLGEGLAEELIYALSTIDSLNVISRTSSFRFMEHDTSLSTIAEELGANYILEGQLSVQGDRIRIRTQLIEAEADTAVWSGAWDRPMTDLFALQDDISLVIAEQLREQLGHFEIDQHLIEAPTNSIDAYQLSLKARTRFNTWSPDGVKEAVSLYEQALKIDPEHADAHVGLADAFGFLATTEILPRAEAWQKAMEHTDHAYRLSPNHAGVHYQLGQLAFFTRCDYAAAYAHNQRALKLRPNYPEALQFMAFFEILRHDFDAARSHINHAYTIDPFSNETLFFDAYRCFCQEDYKGALERIDRCLEQNPQNIPASFTRTQCLIQLGQVKEALDYVSSLPDAVSVDDEVLGLRAVCHLLLHHEKEATAAITELQARNADPGAFQAHAYLFLVYTLQNAFDLAFSQLQHSLERHSAVILLYLSNPMSKALRSDPRYPAIFEKAFAISLPKKVQRSAPLLQPKDAEHFQQALIARMEDEQDYLNPSLSLRGLADVLGLTANQLSWLLNECLEQNFARFINGYRIEHFKRLAVNPDNAHISLIGLAYESGFNSKTVFNTTFKKLVGQTPKAYLAASKGT